MAILAVNVGSSTLKFSLHPRAGQQVQPSIFSGSIQGLEPGGAPVLEWSRPGRRETRALPPSAQEPFDQALHCLRELLTSEPDLPAIEAVAHRVVHGGRDFRASVRVSAEVLARLEQLNALAPLHQPHNLQGIRAFQKAFPELPQVASFDTAFHANMPEVEYSLPLPQSLTDAGLRRYGFHGLSYQHVMGVLQQHSEHALGRVLMAHLGNGASLCAARDGLCYATTMGFSTLDGLMMGTRTGSLDPGVLLYLMEQGWDHEQLQTLLYRQSGLLGVSGISADMRRLRADGSIAARRAIDLFTHCVLRESGALVATLGGLDVLSFSGGIGEHDVVLRSQLCARLAWMGVRVDEALNQQAVGTEVVAIHAANSRVQVWVIPTDEGRIAAQEAARLL